MRLRELSGEELQAYDDGYKAALEHTTAQVEALQAENATLQMEIEATNMVAGEWEENAAELQAENERLRLLLKSMLNIFDDGLPRDSERRHICDKARRELGE